MKTIVTIGAILGTLLAWRIIGVLSADAIGMAVGLVFGIAASIPAVLMLANKHNDNDEPRQTQRIVYIQPPNQLSMPAAPAPRQLQAPQIIIIPPPRAIRAQGSMPALPVQNTAITYWEPLEYSNSDMPPCNPCEEEQ